jgi:AI-2 transport protein TqsA
MPIAGQRPGSFAVLLVAGIIVICAGLQSAASIVVPVFIVITLVIIVAPLRALLVARHWPSC